MIGAAASGSYQGMEIIGSMRSAAATGASGSMRLSFPCFSRKMPARGALAGEAMFAVMAGEVRAIGPRQTRSVALEADALDDLLHDWLTELLMATEDRGVDVILDIIGAKYLEQNISALRPDGRLVIIGMQKGTKAELDIAKLLNKRATITATSLRGRPVEQKSEIVRQVAERVWPLITARVIQLAPETRFSLRDAAAAHEILASGSNVGKLILTLE